MKSIFPATTRARFALIIVITLVPVFGTTFLSYLREKHVLLSHIKEDVMRVTRIAAGTQELAINGAFQLLMALAITMPKGEQAAQKLLAGLQNANPVYKAIGFVAPDGTLVSTSSNIPPIDFSTHREGNMDFAIDAWFEEGPRSGLVMSHYFRIDSRESKAAFFALIDMKQFYGFTGLQLPDDSEYLLLTEKGVVLAASPSANMWARKDSPLIAAILSRREGTIELGGRDGKTRLYAFKPLSSVADTGVYISVGLPLSVYSELDNLLALDLLVFVFSIIAGFLIWTLTDRTLISRVNSLVGTAKKLSAGEMKARTGLKHNSRGEIERIAEALDQLAETLEHRNVQLESYQEQLRSMTSELLLIEKRERHRIATEMHDRIGQTLAISKIKLGALIKKHNDNPLGLRLAEVRNYINQAIIDTRSIIYKISSPILYELGLDAALEWLSEQFQKEHGIAVCFRCDYLERQLEEGVRTLLFQAANELLVNIVKHARASKVSISCTREDDFVRIEVEDNGAGFEPNATVAGRGISGGFGLFGIRERLKHARGTMEVISSPGNGTRIIMKAPVKIEVEPLKR